MTLDEVVAREEIRATIARYNLAGDRGRLEELAACFTEDGELEVVGDFHARGRAEIQGRLGAVASGWAGEGRRLVRHNVTTHGVELVSPTEANAWSYFLVLMDGGLDHAGRYVDRLRKVGDRWLLQHRRVRVEWRVAPAGSAAPSAAASFASSAAALEAIREVKARYFRLMDQRRWDEWIDVFTEDVAIDVTDDAPGFGILKGRVAMAKAVRSALRGCVSVHHGHMPEIELTSATTARGTWTMQDWLDYEPGHTPRTVRGKGFYFEEYRREADGVWRISAMTLRRLWLERDGVRVVPRPEAG